MSHQTLFALPIQFAYADHRYCQWKLQKDGLLGWKDLRVWGSPLTLMPPRVIDAWELRREFFEVGRHENDVVDFLNRTNWSGGSLKAVRDFWRWQDLFRNALVRRYEQWANLEREFGTIRIQMLLSGLHAHIRWNGKYPVGRIKVDTSFGAILTTIQIDKMMGVGFGVCARPDCKKIYQIKTKHGRKYCCQYCAHLEDVRRDRQQEPRRKKNRKRAV